jgi:hypothetical protein
MLWDCWLCVLASESSIRNLFLASLFSGLPRDVAVQVLYVCFAHNKLIRVEEDQGVHGWTAKYKVASCLLAVCVLRSAPTFSFKFFECVKGVDPSAVEHWAGGHFLDIVYKTPALRILEFVAGAIAGRLVILMPSDVKEWKFFAHFRLDRLRDRL